VSAQAPKQDKKTQLWGYVNEKNKWIIKPQFIYTGQFSRMPGASYETAWVADTDSLYSLINLEGENVLKQKYYSTTGIKPFTVHEALVGLQKTKNSPVEYIWVNNGESFEELPESSGIYLYEKQGRPCLLLMPAKGGVMKIYDDNNDGTAERTMLPWDDVPFVCDEDYAIVKVNGKIYGVNLMELDDLTEAQPVVPGLNVYNAGNHTHGPTKTKCVVLTNKDGYVYGFAPGNSLDLAKKYGYATVYDDSRNDHTIAVNLKTGEELPDEPAPILFRKCLDYVMNDGVEEYKANNKIIVDLVSRAAQQNYPPAVQFLGEIYETGQYGVSRNNGKGLELYKLAQKLYADMTEAQMLEDPMVPTYLGLSYRFNQGVGKNDEKALKYLNLAASKNFALALHWLGVYYRPDDKNANANKVKYLDYMNKALAADSLAWTGTNLGYYYLDRDDWKNAAKYFKIAADRKNAKGRVELAYMLRTGGHGLDRDLYKAIEIYEKETVKRENTFWFEKLAECYVELGEYRKARSIYEDLINYDFDYINKIEEINQLMRKQRDDENNRKNANFAAQLYKTRDFVGRPLGVLDIMKDSGYIKGFEKIWDGYSGAIFNCILKDGSKYRIEINKNAIIEKANRLKK
ncbi:MAG: WG repeat-containing protein, partial [Muribaculaceae bacterium]|nr:WG repeat-containing protein [Muribaculaceae bacterium]